MIDCFEGKPCSSDLSVVSITRPMCHLFLGIVSLFIMTTSFTLNLHQGTCHFCLKEMFRRYSIFPILPPNKPQEVASFWENMELMEHFLSIADQYLKRYRTPTNELIKSGPVSKVSFKEMPFNFAEQSKNTLVCLGSLGGIPRGEECTRQFCLEQPQELALHHLSLLFLPWKWYSAHDIVCCLYLSSPCFILSLRSCVNPCNTHCY